LNVIGKEVETGS